MDQVDKKILETITITIFPTSNDDGGFAYDIYDVEASEVEDVDSLDGGQCTSEDIKDALQMATSQALDLIRSARYNIKS